MLIKYLSFKYMTQHISFGVTAGTEWNEKNRKLITRIKRFSYNMFRSKSGLEIYVKSHKKRFFSVPQEIPDKKRFISSFFFTNFMFIAPVE